MIKKIRRKIGGGSIEGFTLVEMLIVVAIIAILIAISIPTVQTALEKSRHAVDDANKRAAIGLGNIILLTDAPTSETTYFYMVDPGTHQGKLDSAGDESGTFKKVTGKCTGSGVTGTDACDDTTEAVGAATVKIGRTKKNLKVTIKTDGTVTADWN